MTCGIMGKTFTLVCRAPHWGKCPTLPDPVVFDRLLFIILPDIQNTPPVAGRFAQGATVCAAFKPKRKAGACLKRTYTLHGIKLQNFGIIMSLGIFSLCAVFLAVSAALSERYEEMTRATEDYISCIDNAITVQAASDYLTEQVRLYAQNGDRIHMERYFQEANVACRREKALAETEAIYQDPHSAAFVEAAVHHSMELMKQELYAMKLVSLAMGYGEGSLPQEVRAVELSAADKALSREDMLVRARNLVFNQGYENAKALINTNLNDYMEDALASVWSRQQASEKAVRQALNTQRLLTLLLVCFSMLIFSVIIKQVVKPLQQFISSIQRQIQCRPEGVYELQYLAHTYNAMYEQNAASAAQEALLRHKAEHDPLTGLMNRRGFEEAAEMLQGSPKPLALIHIDVDHFKQVNDTYGHMTGDRVLQKLSAVLTQHFSAQDYLFRMGGDEFCVIIMGVTREQGHVVKNRILQINNILQAGEDGLPPFTLSAGVAFSPAGYGKLLFDQADQALYQVKAQGRCGCRIYSEL